MQSAEWQTSRGVFDGYSAGPDDGELVLLLHGFPQDAWQWRKQLPLLASQGYRVVAANARGITPAVRPREVDAYAMAELVADVLALADCCHREQFHLVGHDWGGAVAWQVAGRHPDRVASLTVLSTPHPAAFSKALADSSTDQAQRSGYMKDFQREDSAQLFLANDARVLRTLYRDAGLDEESIRHYLERFRQPGVLDRFLNWYRTGSPADSGQLTIRAPTLYLWGDEDVALGQEAARWTDDFCRGPYTFVVVRDGSHWLSEQSAEIVNPRLIGHLKRYRVHQ